MLSRRQLDILIKLMDSEKTFSGEEIARKFNVTVRTVRSDIKKINNYLTPFKICIISSNKFGYQLEKESIRKIHEDKIFELIKKDSGFEIPQTPNERLSFLCFLLSKNESYSIEELSDYLYLSIPSIYNDMHTIADIITNKFSGLKLTHKDGKYRIIGKEIDKRNMISGIISQRYNKYLESKYAEYISNNGEFLTLLYGVISTVSVHEKECSFRLSGEGLYSFSTDIALSWIREKQMLHVEYTNINLNEEFLYIKQVMCEDIPCLQDLNEQNWSYLQTRFYAKEFLVESNKMNISIDVNKVIKSFQLLLSKKYKLSMFNDEKSVDYLIRYLEYIYINEQSQYYWNVEDKDGIVEEHIFCYLLAIEFAWICERETRIHLNKASLSIIALLIKESYMRSKVKKRGLLVTNKDRAHVVYYINTIVSEFWDSIDLIDYCTAYDVHLKLVQIDAFDTIISTESLEDYGCNKYLKITSLCNETDIKNIKEIIKKDDLSSASVFYKSVKLNISYMGDDLEEICKEIIHTFEEMKVQVTNRLLSISVENYVYLQLNHGVLRMISPFISELHSTIYQISLHRPILYKKKVAYHIEFIVAKSSELENMCLLFKR